MLMSPLQRGFTLIEVLVSVAIFSIVMTVSLGALLSMSDSNRRAEALKSVINNLNFGLDSMSRAIRTGYSYHCGNSGDLGTPATADCASGAAQSYFAFLASNGNKTAYCLYNGAVRRQITLGTLSSDCTSSNFSSITSSEVNVTRLQFIVIGATSATIQPKVTILLSGAVRVSGTASTTFSLETSVSQRLYDQ